MESNLDQKNIQPYPVIESSPSPIPSESSISSNFSIKSIESDDNNFKFDTDINVNKDTDDVIGDEFNNDIDIDSSNSSNDDSEMITKYNNMQQQILNELRDKVRSAYDSYRLQMDDLNKMYLSSS